MTNNISLGIMVYNEEKNIGRLLEAVCSQVFTFCLQDIIVVSSGCTDRTEKIVISFTKKDRRIKLLVQPKREGKASAINLFLSHAQGEILILESGDTLPDKNTLNELIAPFKNSEIGMTGAHPIPVNSKNTFIGFTVNLMWFLHHKIALTSPKLGELVAFRNFVKKIPNDTAVDESSIESIVRKKGYVLCYVPTALVYNKGPDNIKDFIKQRRRIAAGHKHLFIGQDHDVSTNDPLKIIVTLLKYHSWSFKGTIWTLGAIFLELIGRLLGYYDYYLLNKNPYIWDISKSTKRLS